MPPKSQLTWKQAVRRSTGPDGYTFGDLSRLAGAKARRRVLSSVKSRVIELVGRLYVERVKPGLTPDMHMPMSVRRAIHELADMFFISLMNTLPASIDRLLDGVQEARELQSELESLQPMLSISLPAAPAAVMASTPAAETASRERATSTRSRIRSWHSGSRCRLSTHASAHTSSCSRDASPNGSPAPSPNPSPPPSPPSHAARTSAVTCCRDEPISQRESSPPSLLAAVAAADSWITPVEAAKSPARPTTGSAHRPVPGIASTSALANPCAIAMPSTSASNTPIASADPLAVDSSTVHRQPVRLFFELGEDASRFDSGRFMHGLQTISGVDTRHIRVDLIFADDADTRDQRQQHACHQGRKLAVQSIKASTNSGPNTPTSATDMDVVKSAKSDFAIGGTTSTPIAENRSHSGGLGKGKGTQTPPCSAVTPPCGAGARVPPPRLQLCATLLLPHDEAADVAQRLSTMEPARLAAALGHALLRHDDDDDTTSSPHTNTHNRAREAELAAKAHSPPTVASTSPMSPSFTPLPPHDAKRTSASAGAATSPPAPMHACGGGTPASGQRLPCLPCVLGASHRTPPHAAREGHVGATRTGAGSDAVGSSGRAKMSTHQTCVAQQDGARSDGCGGGTAGFGAGAGVSDYADGGDCGGGESSSALHDSVGCFAVGVADRNGLGHSDGSFAKAAAAGSGAGAAGSGAGAAGSSSESSESGSGRESTACSAEWVVVDVPADGGDGGGGGSGGGGDGGDHGGGSCGGGGGGEAGTRCWPSLTALLSGQYGAARNRLVADAWRARAALLYHYLPYDKSLWGRLHSPPSVLLQLVAMFPTLAVRAAFFSVLLACLLVEPEAHQLTSFILAHKGSQMLTGVMFAVQGMLSFWFCAAVLEPEDAVAQSQCKTLGPGVSYHSFFWDAVAICWLQGLVFLACALLPRAQNLTDPKSPGLDSEDLVRANADNTNANARNDNEHEKDDDDDDNGEVGGNNNANARRDNPNDETASGNACAASENGSFALGDGADVASNGTLPRHKEASARRETGRDRGASAQHRWDRGWQSMWERERRRGGPSCGYERLSEEPEDYGATADAHATDSTPAATTSSGGDGATAAAATAAAAHTANAAAVITEPARRRLRLCLRFNSAGVNTRILALLRWDWYCFVTAAALCVAGVFATAVADAAHRCSVLPPDAAQRAGSSPETWTAAGQHAGMQHGVREGFQDVLQDGVDGAGTHSAGADGFADVGAAVSHAWLVLSQASLALTQAETWEGWRAKSTFFVFMRVLFALSTFPFLFFELPGFRRLLSASTASGYDNRGLCLPQDEHGLSSFVGWLGGRMKSKRFTRHLGPREKHVLNQAVSQARAHLAANPSEHRLFSDRRREELDALLTSMIPPSHPLFSAVFPNRMLVNELSAKLADSNLLHPRGSERARRRREGKGKKYDVPWEDDAAVDHCRQCGDKWTMLRRRHHCRSCGQLVCAGCSQSRLPVPGSDNWKRVCDHCAGLRNQAASTTRD